MRARWFRPISLLVAAPMLALAWMACSTEETQDPSNDASGAGGALSCSDACRADHQSALELYDALDSCLYCNECFADCDGAPRGCAAPDAQGTCDGKGICQDTDTDPDDDCATCALAGPCKDVLEVCQGSSTCVALVLCLEPC
ncbi:MAG: hypothetical protein WKG00_41655 [Polyangiaceae bacterium]